MALNLLSKNKRFVKLLKRHGLDVITLYDNHKYLKSDKYYHKMFMIILMNATFNCRCNTICCYVCKKKKETLEYMLLESKNPRYNVHMCNTCNAYIMFKDYLENGTDIKKELCELAIAIMDNLKERERYHNNELETSIRLEKKDHKEFKVLLEKLNKGNSDD